MNQPTPIRTELSHAEETLRLVAKLPAPAGLEVRIQETLDAAPVQTRVLHWPAKRSSGSEWRRGAAAAALVAAIFGGTWAVYSRVQPSASFRAVEMPRVTGSGSFSNAGAMRTPQTLAVPAEAAPRPADPAVKQTPSAKKKAAPAAAAR